MIIIGKESPELNYMICALSSFLLVSVEVSL